jgi:hypothetical protein
MFGGLAFIAELPNLPILFSVKFVVASHDALVSISKMYLPAVVMRSVYLRNG